jgi:hypothetical protein
MRSNWVPLSASALVIGVMSLVFATLLNPGQSASSTAETLQVVSEQGSRWLAMSVMFILSSITLVFGMPAVVTLFQHRRGRRLGMTAVAVFTVGAIGTCGIAMLLVFFRAIVVVHAVRGTPLDHVGDDSGLRIFLFGWFAGFYGGLLLLAIALLLSRSVSWWIPAALVVFLAFIPFASHLGRVGGAMQILLLAVAFTGIAMAAVQGAATRSAEADAAF